MRLLHERRLLEFAHRGLQLLDPCLQLRPPGREAVHLVSDRGDDLVMSPVTSPMRDLMNAFDSSSIASLRLFDRVWIMDLTGGARFGGGEKSVDFEAEGWW